MIDIAFEEKIMKYSPVPIVVVNNNGKVVERTTSSDRSSFTMT